MYRIECKYGCGQIVDVGRTTTRGTAEHEAVLIAHDSQTCPLGVDALTLCTICLLYVTDSKARVPPHETRA